MATEVIQTSQLQARLTPQQLLSPSNYCHTNKFRSHDNVCHPSNGFHTHTDTGRETEARKELELLFGIAGEQFIFKEHGAALTFHEQRMDEITGTNIFRLHP